LGSKELSRHGAIVTRLSAIEDMAGMAVLCSDKTGTMTLNKMVLQNETMIYSKTDNQYNLLRYAAMAARWKEPPKDALDSLTLQAVDLPSLECMDQLDFMPFDPVVKRTEGTVRDNRNGVIFKTSKGAPHILVKLIQNVDLQTQVLKDVEMLGERGIRCLAVAKTKFDNINEWEFLGLLTFLDPPRPDTLQTIKDAHRYGVAVKMITGDHLLIAKETARRLEMVGSNIIGAEGLPLLDPVTKQKPPMLSEMYGDHILSANGFAEVFPEHKYLIVECIRELGYKVGMTGDGVNDAPALRRADVGIAVQGATDAARAAADIVLTQPGLSTIIHGILTARCIFVRIRNFITYRIAATLQLLWFFFIATFAFTPVDYEPEDQDDHYWPTFFHLPVIMLMLITLLNDGTLIAIGYDNVIPSDTPSVWNLRVLFLIGTVLALVACMSSILLLYLLLDSWRDDSFSQVIGLGGISYGQVTTSIFLKVAVSDFLSLFSARAGESWFWTSTPSRVLVTAASFALSVSTLLACYWPLCRPDNIPTLGLKHKSPGLLLPALIWIYCIIWWFIQDAVKVGTYSLIKRFNIFNYNETGMTPSEAQNYARTNSIPGSPSSHNQGAHSHFNSNSSSVSISKALHIDTSSVINSSILNSNFNFLSKTSILVPTDNYKSRESPTTSPKYSANHPHSMQMNSDSIDLGPMSSSSSTGVALRRGGPPADKNSEIVPAAEILPSVMPTKKTNFIPQMFTSSQQQHLNKGD
jgi:H+-transporting ATPase